MEKLNQPLSSSGVHKHSITREGNIKVYDSVLATDGTQEFSTIPKGHSIDTPILGPALYDFILTQAATPPKILVHCKGHHIWEFPDPNTKKLVREEIPDFNFTIDLSSAFGVKANAREDVLPIWIVGDGESTYRGRMTLDVELPAVVGPQELEEGSAISSAPRRKATKDEVRLAKLRDGELRLLGLPPWIRFHNDAPGMQAGIDNENVFRNLKNATYPQAPPGRFSTQLHPSLKSLRDIADDFCASRKPLKEFRFRRTTFGWNFPDLQRKVREIVWSNKPLTCQVVTVKVEVQAGDIIVRPDNFLWMILTNKWILFLLWITLLYPIFIWPMKKLFLAGRWWMAGCSYTFSQPIRITNSTGDYSKGPIELDCDTRTPYTERDFLRTWEHSTLR